MAEIRLALIGCGEHSESAHASSLAHFVAQNPGIVSLAATCDRNIERAERFCKAYGFGKAHSDVETMLDAEKPDGVVSVLPIERIAEVDSVLLRRRIPCVLEKPPGRSLEEARALADLARQTGAPHMVSMNRRFSPYLRLAAEWAEEIGPLRYVRGRMLRHARREDDFLWGTGVHVVDAVCHLGGALEAWDVQRLDCSSQRPPWFLISLRFRSGATGCVEIVPTAGMDDEVFDLFGDDYRACARTLGGRGESVRCWRNNALEKELSANPADPLFLRNGSYEETTAFIHSLTESSPLRPSLQDVLPALEVCGA